MEETRTFPLFKVKSCYSQSFGYWHGRNTPINVNSNPVIYSLESPPTTGYNCGPEHEQVGGGIFTTRGSGPNASPQVSESNLGKAVKGDINESPMELFELNPPPPSCDPFEEDLCYLEGGEWDSIECSCDLPY